jgi:RNA polymerase sigma-70 factor (ECF subfamily)
MPSSGIQKQYNFLTDEEIVNLIVNENKNELFEIIYGRYRRKVMDKCRSMLKSEGIAVDATQDIFSKVFVKLASFRRQSTFSTWLYAITYHYCIEYLRRIHDVHYPSWNSQNLLPELIEESEDQLSGIQYDNLVMVLEMIHPEEKALLLMKYQDDMPISYIQEVLKISESAVKMRLKRAKARVIYLYNLKFKGDD